MIKHDNFSQFVRCIHLSIKKAANPPATFTLAQCREAVADALAFPKREEQRKRRLEHFPIPFDSDVCERIAGRFAQEGISLPVHSWEWPLPAGMSLTSGERLANWQEALAQRQHGLLDGELDAFRSVEPYIKPAGDGKWHLCNRSPVPFTLCARVLGTERVAEKLADNSIADDEGARSSKDKDFHAALVDRHRYPKGINRPPMD